MSRHRKEHSSSEAWAHFRFAAVGPLLAAPPRDGDLQGALEDLAAVSWTHPITGEPVKLSDYADKVCLVVNLASK